MRASPYLVILLGVTARSAAMANVPVCGAITTSATWTKNNVYKVNCVNDSHMIVSGI